MVDVVIVGEGPTEETFVRTVLAPYLAGQGVYATPRLIRTSPSQAGGALTAERVTRFLRNTLRERADTYVSTMFDLYGLDPDLPGVAASRGVHNPEDRAAQIEQQLCAAIVAVAGCRPERFTPHVQPHEFEALLFSDVERLCQFVGNWAASANDLHAVRGQYETPEWINGSFDTIPSRRLHVLSPKYRKTTDGPMAAEHIGLDRIREECPHFNAWVERLLALPAL